MKHYQIRIATIFAVLFASSGSFAGSIEVLLPSTSKIEVIGLPKKIKKVATPALDPAKVVKKKKRVEKVAYKKPKINYERIPESAMAAENLASDSARLRTTISKRPVIKTNAPDIKLN